MKFLKASLKALTLLGWGIPLIGAVYLLINKLRCMETDMLCSFPFTDSASILLNVSLVWLLVAIGVFIFSEFKSKKTSS